MFDVNLISKDKIFLTENDTHYSYEHFYKDVAIQKSFYQKNIANQSCIALLAESTYFIYVQLIAALNAGHIVILIPQIQFNDLAYRQFLAIETQTDFFYINKKNIIDAPSSFNKCSKALELFNIQKSGFIVRTSGSTSSKFKYILHRSDFFVKKYQKRKSHFKKTLAFSPSDSIAGYETLFETITTGAHLVCGNNRLQPDTVAELIYKNEIDYFQTTPTFINLMLLSKNVDSIKLKSLTKIAFGSEPSSKKVLSELQSKLTHVVLNHTYGMSEIGIQITQTNQSDPTTFSLDAEFNVARTVDGLLQVKSLTPMIGYLNVETPALHDGWFQTYDQVEQKNEFFRVLGRSDEIINVAGRKFFPFDLEELVLKFSPVKEAIVISEINDFIGQSVTLKIAIAPYEDELLFRKNFKTFCEKNIPIYMHPHRIFISKENLLSFELNRFKKIRRL